jgi:hypothetical protein
MPKMRGVDEKLLNEVLDRHLEGRLTIGELYTLAVEAGAIEEDEALQAFHHNILRDFIRRRNRESRTGGRFDQQIFSFKCLSKDGRYVEFRVPWFGTNLLERVQIYGREWVKCMRQARKCQEIYRHALEDFGPEEAREFEQRCLIFGPPPTATEDVLSGQQELF